jgi:membrane protein DedA with SNARE-associated domain
MEKNFNVSNEIKEEILKNLIEPSYRHDLSTNLKLKNYFKRIGFIFESLSKFFVGVSSVLSFSSGIYKYQVLSFLAGTTSVVSLILLQYSSYAYKESKKVTIEINKVLSKLHIETILDESSDKFSLEANTPKTDF